MALLRGASAPDPDDVRPLKPCLLRRNHSRDQHGVAASCLEELRSKGWLPGAPGGVAKALIDIPCSELARELCQSCATVQGLQNTLQQVLDQREEARQSKQLLELYLRALEKEGDILSNQEESKAALSEDLDAVDTGISKEMASDVALTSRILTTLREKPSPELSLSSQDLELVSKEDPKALAVALNWDIKKAETVQQACNTELTLRLQQMQSLRSLRNFSARKNPLPGEQQSPKRAKQDPE
ncbi:DNA fragmentation factor alpha subunit [Cricetulus griseus]